MLTAPVDSTQRCPASLWPSCCRRPTSRRLHFCDAATQRTYFARQFELARSSGLPMFLHLRAAAADFLDIVQQHAGGAGPCRAGFVACSPVSALQAAASCRCSKNRLGPPLLRWTVVVC